MKNHSLRAYYKVSIHFYQKLSHERSRKKRNEIKRLSDRLDAIRHQQAGLSLVESADKYAGLERKRRWKREYPSARYMAKTGKEAQKLMNLPFRRAIAYKERADMGKLKKRTRPDRGHR